MNEVFVARLIELSEKALKHNEVPIAAILIKDEQIIAEAFNSTESLGRFTAHAEMLCIDEATKKLGTKYLNGCRLLVSVEPCQMCSAALALSRIEAVNFLLTSEKYGSTGRAYPELKVEKIDCQQSDRQLQLLQEFFKAKR